MMVMMIAHHTVTERFRGWWQYMFGYSRQTTDDLPSAPNSRFPQPVATMMRSECQAVVAASEVEQIDVS